MNVNDEIRSSILQYLYEVHRKARSVKATAQGINDIKSGMKERGVKGPDVSSNLDYLVQKDWVKREVESRSFRTKTGTIQPSEKVTYKISHIGIDRLETASVFANTPVAPHVNVTTINGVTVVGDNNIVNTTYSSLYHHLTEMKKAVLTAPKLEDGVKLEAASDIESLQAQLHKPAPNKGIVKSLWGVIDKTVTGAGFVELVKKGAELLKPLIG